MNCPAQATLFRAPSFVEGKMNFQSEPPLTGTISPAAGISSPRKAEPGTYSGRSGWSKLPSSGLLAQAIPSLFSFARMSIGTTRLCFQGCPLNQENGLRPIAPPGRNRATETPTVKAPTSSTASKCCLRRMPGGCPMVGFIQRCGLVGNAIRRRPDPRVAPGRNSPLDV